MSRKIPSYEATVYSDQTQEMVRELLEVVRRHTADIPEDRIRYGLAAAALVCTAQIIDGSTWDHPIVENGVTGRLVRCVDEWKTR